MPENGRYKFFGVYVSQPVYDALTAYLYEEAGIVDFAEYFDPAEQTIPVGDPGADATAELVSSVVSDFPALYDEAEFDATRDVDPNSFVLVRLAAEPGTVANARERFQAAATVRDTDLRTVQTAVLEAWLSRTDADDRTEPP
ncbi:hypothetical protein EA462_06740 [Natrarchaeobius halalkaliphilus]|uniref:Uncharacterized protein n=1 Tax=Natrarchaeobius halalkaliphilus TaxID=1679091 RepID=A0A3N6P245_9EURY|nr:hypothetical protein [Natrarchaeobius halalkaliphilus]RQG91639.1 hypothetical protein EA462_06740 [Natrarchaeobius halalkaliphilus]